MLCEGPCNVALAQLLIIAEVPQPFENLAALELIFSLLLALECLL